MRALLSTIGSRGDVQPLLALALELKTLGHDVHLCAPPDFREWIEGLGLEVTTIGPELRKLTSSSPPAAAALPSPEQQRQSIDATVATQFETVAAAARGCDVIVAATALQIAARSVAELMGVPYVFVAYCPTVLPSEHHAPPPLRPMPGLTTPAATTDNRELWKQNAVRFNATFGAALNAHRASLGLSTVDDVSAHIFTERPWLVADPTLAPWPDAADDSVFQTGAWLLNDERPLSAELEAFLAGGEPPIYFGFGSMRAPQDVSQVIVETARALGRRAIVSRGWADVALANEDPDFLVIGEVNQQALFSRVAAIVHHGGAGTTTAASRSGAPQVVVPQMYDQHYFARRVQELGIGVAHAAGAPTTESLTIALEQALQPHVAIAARSVAKAVRTDGARIAAQALSSG